MASAAGDELRRFAPMSDFRFAGVFIEYESLDNAYLRAASLQNVNVFSLVGQQVFERPFRRVQVHRLELFGRTLLRQICNFGLILRHCQWGGQGNC